MYTFLSHRRTCWVIVFLVMGTMLAVSNWAPYEMFTHGAPKNRMALSNYAPGKKHNPNILQGAMEKSFVFNCSNLEVITQLDRPRILSVWRWTDGHPLKEHPLDRKRSFEGIFIDRVWRGQKVAENPEGLTGSGRGSTLLATRRVRTTLSSLIPIIKDFLGKDKIRMLDIPCGDMTWMHHVIRTRTDVDYTGMDIVPELVERHQHFYKNVSHMNFRQGDIVANPLRESYDLVFTREMTQHLTTADALTVLKHISNSGSRFLLATSVPAVKRNTQVKIIVGKPGSKKADRRRYRPQNLTLPPYNLSEPLCLAVDITVGDREHNLLWPLPLYRD